MTLVLGKYTYTLCGSKTTGHSQENYHGKMDLFGSILLFEIPVSLSVLVCCYASIVMYSSYPADKVVSQWTKTDKTIGISWSKADLNKSIFHGSFVVIFVGLLA